MYPSKDDRKIREKQIKLEIDAIERTAYQGNKRLRQLNYELGILDRLNKFEKEEFEEVN